MRGRARDAGLVAVGYLLGLIVSHFAHGGNHFSASKSRPCSVATAVSLMGQTREQQGSAEPSLAEMKIIVQPMCRCNSGSMPVTSLTDSVSGVLATGISQEQSVSMGGVKRLFFLRNNTRCHCRPALGAVTHDMYLSRVEASYCSPAPADSRIRWSSLPDFGVQQKLPLFLGVLSYKSPKSLYAAFSNWQQQGLHSVGLAGTFVQLNARSAEDETVLTNFNTSFNITISGNSSENLHPGLAISRFCRAAEQAPTGHPGGENLLLFLEKDWQLRLREHRESENLQSIFHSVNTLVQRGVPYVRLTEKLPKVESWQCDAEGSSWDCTVAHQQRYTNLPSVIRCDWFLRYLEPFALIHDSIMFGCRRDARRRRYFDWEEAMQDGRIAWPHTQWVVANRREGRSPLFRHVEVDS